MEPTGERDASQIALVHAKIHRFARTIFVGAPVSKPRSLTAENRNVFQKTIGIDLAFEHSVAVIGAT